MKDDGFSAPAQRMPPQRSHCDKFVFDRKGQMPPWRGTLNETELDQL